MPRLKRLLEDERSVSEQLSGVKRPVKAGLAAVGRPVHATNYSGAVKTGAAALY
jgi:hypothetical protein